MSYARAAKPPVDLHFPTFIFYIPFDRVALVRSELRRGKIKIYNVVAFLFNNLFFLYLSCAHYFPSRVRPFTLVWFVGAYIASSYIRARRHPPVVVFTCGARAHVNRKQRKRR